MCTPFQFCLIETLFPCHICVSIIISHYFWLRSAGAHWYMAMCLCGCVISVVLREHGVCTWLVFSRQLTGLWWLLLLHLWNGGYERKIKTQDRGGKNEGNVEGKWGGKLTQALNGPTVERGEQVEETNKRGRGETDYVFTLDYFCGRVSVCSSCG